MSMSIMWTFMTRSQSVAADQLTYMVETICSGTVFAGRRLCLKQIKKKQKNNQTLYFCCYEHNDVKDADKSLSFKFTMC